MLSSQYNIQQNMQTGSAGIQIFQDINTSADQSVRFGEGAGKLSFGTGNAFMGYQAGEQNLGGSYDTFIGYQAGQFNQNSSSTTLVGAFAGRQNTNGNETVYVGYRAGEFNLNGDQNVGVGAYALRENNSGSGTTAVGWAAAERNLDGDYNTMIGAEAGQNNRSGNYNTMAGYRVGRATFAANENTFFGAYAGYSNEYGSDNCLIGYKAGLDVVNGNFNIAIGAYSLATGRSNSGSLSDCNVVIGAFTNTTGSGNVVLGLNAGSNSTGDDNVLIGKDVALTYTGHKSVIVGSRALVDGNGECNTMIGYGIAPSFVSGSNNVLIGVGADTYGDATSYTIAIGTSNVQTYTHSIAIGDALDNKRRETILIGFDINTIADNSVLIGKTLNINNATVFKDPLSYPYIATINTKADELFGPTDIDYSYLLVSPTSILYPVAGAGQFTSNIVSSRGNPRTTSYVQSSDYNIITGNGQFDKALIHYASSRFINTNDDANMDVSQSSLIRYYKNYGDISTFASNSIGSTSNVYSNQVSFEISYDTNNVVTNLTGFNTSNTTYNIYIQKQVQDASFKYVSSDVLANRIAGTKDTRGGTISSDTNGNIYFTGLYSSATIVTLQNLDKTQNYSYTLPSTNTQAIFIVKYNTSGIITGATRIDGATIRSKGSLCTDTNGYIYAAGDYTGTGSPSNIDGTYSSRSLVTTSVANAFVTKYTPEGILIGAASVITPNTSTSLGIYVDSGSNIYAAGCYNSSNNQNISLYNLDGSISIKTLTKTLYSSTNSFVIHYGSNGDVVSTTSIIGMDPDSTGDVYGGSYARSICGDMYNNIYVVGDHRNKTSTNIIKNLDAANLNSSYQIGITSNTAGYIIRYNSSRLVSGLCLISGASNVYNTSTLTTTEGYVQVYDAKSDTLGNLYITGTYLTSYPISLKNINGSVSAYSLPTATDSALYIIKYNTNGNIEGCTSINGIDTYTAETGYSISCDSGNSVYVTGSYNTSTKIVLKNLDGTTSSYSLSASKGGASFLIKYGVDGYVKNVQTIDGFGVDVGSGIHADNANNVYWGGTYLSSTSIPIYDLNSYPGDTYLPYTSPIFTSAYIIKYKSVQDTVYLTNGPLDGSVTFTNTPINTTFVGNSITPSYLNSNNTEVKYVVRSKPMYGMLNTYIQSRSYSNAITSYSSNLTKDIVYTPFHEYAYSYSNSSFGDSFTIHPFLQVTDVNSNVYGNTDISIADKRLLVSRPNYASNVLARNSIVFNSDNSIHTFRFSSNDFVGVPNGLDDSTIILVESYDSTNLDLYTPYPPDTYFTYSNLRRGQITISQKSGTIIPTVYTPITGKLVDGNGTSNSFTITMTSIPTNMYDVKNSYTTQLSYASSNSASDTYTLPSLAVTDVWTVTGTSNGDLQIPNSITNLNQATYRRINPYIKNDTIRLVAKNNSLIQEIEVSFSNANSFVYNTNHQASITCDPITTYTSNYLYITSNVVTSPIINTSNIYTSNITTNIDSGSTILNSNAYYYTTFGLSGTYNNAYGYSNVYSFVTLSNVYPINKQTVPSPDGEITINYIIDTSNIVYSISGDVLGTPEYTTTLVSTRSIPNSNNLEISYTSNVINTSSNIVYLVQASNYVYNTVNQQQNSFYNYGLVHTYQNLLLYSSNTTSNTSARNISRSTVLISSSAVGSGTSTYTSTTSNILEFLEKRSSNSMVPVTRTMMFKDNGNFTFKTQNGFDMFYSNQGVVSSWSQSQIDSGNLYLQLPSITTSPSNKAFVIREALTGTEFTNTFTLYNSNTLVETLLIPTDYNLVYTDRYTSGGKNVKGIYKITGLITYLKNSLGISGFTPSDFLIQYLDNNADHVLLDSTLKQTYTASTSGDSYILHTNQNRSNTHLYMFARNSSGTVITNIIDVPIVFNELPPGGIPRQGFNYGISSGNKNLLNPSIFTHSWSNLPSSNLKASITSTLSALNFRITSNNIVLTDANKEFTIQDCLSGKINIEPLSSTANEQLDYDLVNTNDSSMLVSGLSYSLAAYEYYAFPTSYEVGSNSSLTNILYGSNQATNVFSDSITNVINQLRKSSGSAVDPSDVYMYVEKAPTNGILCDDIGNNIPYQLTLDKKMRYLSYTPDDIQHDRIDIRIGYRTSNISPKYSIYLSNYALPFANMAVEAGGRSSNYPINSFIISSQSNINRYVADGNSFSSNYVPVPLSSSIPLRSYTYPISLYNNTGGLLVSTSVSVYPYALSTRPDLLVTSVSIDAAMYSQTSLKPILGIVSTTYDWNSIVGFVLPIPQVEGISTISKHGVVMKKSYTSQGKLLLTPVSYFTKDELNNDVIVYQHIGTGTIPEALVDSFTCYATSGPYTYNTSPVTVSVSIYPLPYITQISDDYVYYNTTTQAALGVNSLNRFVKVGTVEGTNGTDYVSFNVLQTSNVDIINTRTGSNTVSIFSVKDLEDGYIGYKIQPGFLTTADYSSLWPFSMTISPNGLPSSSGSNELANIQQYSSMFSFGSRGGINIYESSNIILYPQNTNQNLSYTFGTSDTFVGNPMDILFQVKPAQSISTSGMTDLEFIDSSNLRTFAFGISIGSTSGSSNIFGARITNSNITIYTPEYHIQNLNGAILFDEWNTITISSINRDDTTKASISINSLVIYLDSILDTNNLKYVAVTVDETDHKNFTNEIMLRNVANPYGNIPLTYLITNYASTLYLRNLEIDIFTPYNTLTDYNPLANNVIIGKDINVKGTDNINVGKNFSTSGQNNIILGNYIGVDKTNPVGTNDIYESIIIGNNSFINGTVRDIIAIGNSNFNDLSTVDPAQINDFISQKPIIIGNAITSRYIDYNVNIANTFLKTAVTTEQVYIGLNSEKVAIGYDTNQGFNAYQDLYVKHGIYVGASTPTGSNQYALDITGDINVSGNIYRNNASIDNVWNYKLEQYNSNATIEFYENKVVSENSTTATGPIFFNSFATSTGGDLYAIGSYSCRIPYNVPLYNLDGSATSYSLPSTYYGFLNLGTTCIVRYSISGIVNGYSIIDTQLYNSGKSICTDTSGNIYTTGYYQTETGIDATLYSIGVPGTASSTYKLKANTNIGAYVVKYGQDGSVKGATSINSLYSSNYGNGICSYQDTIYVVGSYNSFQVLPVQALTISLSNLDGTFNGTTLPGTNGQEDAYIIRYGPDGKIVASSVIIGSNLITSPLDGSNVGSGMARALTAHTDGMGSLYVAGTYVSYCNIVLNNLTGSNVPSSHILSATGSTIATPNDVYIPASFVIKYDTSGDVVGSTSIFSSSTTDASDQNSAIAIAVDISSNVYLTGTYTSYSSSIILNNLDGTASTYSLPATSIPSSYVIKYEINGYITGVSTVIGTGISTGISICTDIYGYSYIAGKYTSTTPVSLTNLDDTPNALSLDTTTDTSVYILKYSNNGGLCNITTINTPPISLENDNGISIWCDRSDTSSKKNNIYLAGTYLSTQAINLYNMDISRTDSGIVLPASSTDTNSTFIVRYDNGLYSSSSYDYNIPTIYVELGSNVGIGTSFISYGTSLYVEGNEYVSQTLTASNLNFLGSLYQNGIPYVGSQWTTSGCNIYYNKGGVGIGKDPDNQYSIDVIGNINFTGNIYQNGILYPLGGNGYGDGSNASNIWVHSSNQTGVIVPGTGAVSYSSSSNSIFRHSDNNVDYAFDVSFNITNGSGGIGDYKLIVPFVVDTSYYLPNSIIGNAWCTVINGGISNYFPLSIRSPIGTNESNVIIRLINGTAETSLSTLPIGTDVHIAGMVTYVSTSILPTIGSGGSGGSGGNTWINVVGGIYNSNLANVGIGTTRPRYNLDVAGSINFTSNLYQRDQLIDLTGIELVRSNLDKFNPWISTSNRPQIILPSPGTISYSPTSNSLYRHIDNDVEYNFNVTGTITQVSGIGDYTISVPVPINLGCYTSNTIIGNIWSRVSSGSLVNYIPVSVSTIGNGRSNELAVRFVNGTTETPMSILTMGSILQLSGTIEYIASVYPRSGIFLSNVCYQDDYGHVGFNTFGPLRAQVDIVGENGGTMPALFVQQAAGNSYGLYVAGDVNITGSFTIGNSNLYTSNATVYNTLITSNLIVLGSNTTINAYTISTSNVSISNVTGIGPALSVYQKGDGSEYPIADFYDVDVSTNNPALRIANGGNIAIGTTMPIASLHVQGDGYYSSSVGIGTTIKRSILDVYGDAIVSSNIGIGTTVAIAPLHVQGNAYFGTSVGIGTTLPRVGLDLVGDAIVAGNIGIGTTLTDSILDVYGDAIVSSNIGIGTTVAIAPLHVQGNAYFGASVGIGTTIPQRMFHLQGRAYFGSNIGIGTTLPRVGLDLVGDAIVAGNIGIGTTLTRGILDVYGDAIVSSNIGIGTTVAIAPLHVQGNAYFGASLGIGTTIPQRMFHLQGRAYFGSNVGIGTTLPRLGLDLVGDAIVAGNIGIGTITPIAPLHVEGITYHSTNVGIGTTIATVSLDVVGQIQASVFKGCGTGFANMEIYTSGTSWSVPTNVLRWKVTLVGGGGGGGGTSTVAGQTGNGGGSGAVLIGFFNYVIGETTMAYSIGTFGSGGNTNSTGGTGSNTTATYNSVTYTAGGGIGGATHATPNGGGTGGIATGGTFNFNGNKGKTGGVAAATNPVSGYGADTPLGFGMGGDYQGTATGGNGIAGSGYGSGGGGGKNGSATTNRTGGAGAAGLLIIEY